MFAAAPIRGLEAQVFAPLFDPKGEYGYPRPTANDPWARLPEVYGHSKIVAGLESLARQAGAWCEEAAGRGLIPTIVVIKGGGGPTGLYLGHKLGSKVEMASIQISRYDEFNRPVEPRVSGKFPNCIDTKRAILFVDEILDGGVTASVAKQFAIASGALERDVAMCVLLQRPITHPKFKAEFKALVLERDCPKLQDVWLLGMGCDMKGYPNTRMLTNELGEAVIVGCPTSLPRELGGAGPGSLAEPWKLTWPHGVSPEAFRDLKRESLLLG